MRPTKTATHLPFIKWARCFGCTSTLRPKRCASCVCVCVCAKCIVLRKFPATDSCARILSCTTQRERAASQLMLFRYSFCQFSVIRTSAAMYAKFLCGLGTTHLECDRVALQSPYIHLYAIIGHRLFFSIQCNIALKVQTHVHCTQNRMVALTLLRIV